jgi:hypothetical protein
MCKSSSSVVVFTKVRRKIQLDTLSILNDHAELLYQADPHWYRHLTEERVHRMEFRRPSLWKK